MDENQSVEYIKKEQEKARQKIEGLLDSNFLIYLGMRESLESNYSHFAEKVLQVFQNKMDVINSKLQSYIQK